MPRRARVGGAGGSGSGLHDAVRLIHDSLLDATAP